MQIVNTRGNLTATQEITDSLGVISFQEIERSPQHLSYPLHSPQHKTQLLEGNSAPHDSLSAPANSQTDASAELEAMNNSQIEIPFTSEFTYTPDFAVKLFEQNGTILMNQRNFGAQATFSQEFKDKVFTINYKKINDTSNNWVFWLVLGTLALLSYARLRYRKQFDLFVSSVFHHNILLKIIRNTSESSNQLSAMLQVLFSLNISLFIYQIVQYYHPMQLPGLQNIAFVCAGAVVIALLYGAKNAILNALGTVYMCNDFVREYLFNVHVCNRALGISLFPVIICFAFVQPHIISHNTIVTIGYILVGGFYALRIIRGGIMGVRAGISPFYVLLMACVLEFLPLLLLAKTIMIILNSITL